MQQSCRNIIFLLPERLEFWTYKCTPKINSQIVIFNRKCYQILIIARSSGLHNCQINIVNHMKFWKINELVIIYRKSEYGRNSWVNQWELVELIWWIEFRSNLSFMGKWNSIRNSGEVTCMVCELSIYKRFPLIICERIQWRVIYAVCLQSY